MGTRIGIAISVKSLMIARFQGCAYLRKKTELSKIVIISDLMNNFGYLSLENNW